MDQGDQGAGHEGFIKRTRLSRRPATDYSANMAQFVHNRRPQYKGTMGFEMERPSASYVIDVNALTASPQRQCSRFGAR
ncbi:hypothetical protein KCU98_g11532, partial [Aureobasidium melanogenum]